MAKIIICETACMYSLEEGDLHIYEGKVCMSSNGHKHFETADGKHIGCPKDAGVVIRDSVWLRKRDDEEGITRIINQKMRYMDELREKFNSNITYQKELIKVLTEGLA